MALYAASSSSSPPFSPNKYDVFISFRGEDTRRSFTSHLYDAFCKKKIQTYIDDRLPKGDEISSALVQAIEGSSVSVVVFSTNFASSRWCLDELTHILHCKRDQGQLVIPVFYEVDPTHVRHQTGIYEQAFQKHERDLEHQHKVAKWKAALNEVASLAGWDFRGFRDDSELIRNIVEDVLRKLDGRYPATKLKGLIGIDDNCAHIELLLREVQTIGIWGMGGIGKTTIAKAIFSKYSSQYEGCCFMENVRENSGEDGKGLHGLQCKLFSKLLEKKNFHSGTSIKESNFVKCTVSRMKVFIVLDDVSALKQLEYLALDGEHHCFGPGSRIIITTRDKHVLSKGVDEIYKVEKLEFQDSLHLFKLNAFNQSLPMIGYAKQIERAIIYASGIPLALKVLGSFLRGKSENEWDSVLSKLKKIPHEEIQSVLKLSFDGLNHEEKEIFLDIACFLKGYGKEDVISLLDSYGFYATIGIRALQDKALITIEDDKSVWMHDLIQEMGWEVVRQESIKDPGRRSRLCHFEEVCDVLNNNKGSNKVEGILLDVSHSKDIHLSDETFRKMPNLRFFKLYSLFDKRSIHVQLPQGLELFPNKIRYLEWHGYPLKSLPSIFCSEKLVSLCMPNSHLQKLWDGVQDLLNLKMIDLTRSKQLMKLPDFSKALALKEVHLEGCESLHYVHSSILSLHSLVKLVLKGCKKLKSLKSEIHLRSLEYLDMEGCFNLKEFAVSSEKISELNLSETGVEILHSSIGCSSNLVDLYLHGLRLKNLPNELSCLRALTMLNLSNIEVIDNSKLQILFNGLRSLRELELEYCSNITKVPNNILHLSRLETLYLRYCKRLRSLPKLPPPITYFSAKGCMSLENVIASRPLNECNKVVSFENCVNLNDQSLHNIIEDAHSAIIGATYDHHYAYYRYSIICLPGSRVPEWFKYHTTQRSMVIEPLPTSLLSGFAFCVIVQCASTQLFCLQFNCACYLEDSKVGNFTMDWYLPEINSDHVYMWYSKFHSDQTLKEIERRANDQFGTNLKLSFKLSVQTFEEKLKPCLFRNVMKEWGVWPISVSEYKEFARQRELKTNNKRPRDVDGEEPFPQFKKLKLDFDTQTNTCRDVDEMEALLKRMDIT